MSQPKLSQVLRQLISTKRLETQSEIQEQLQKSGIEADQSTISRTLKRLGVIKVPDSEGRMVYRWPAKKAAPRSLPFFVRSIVANENLIILSTDPGSANLVARLLDVQRPEGMLGTLAGDDTIFIAPTSQADLPALLATIRTTFPINK